MGPTAPLPAAALRQTVGINRMHAEVGARSPALRKTCAGRRALAATAEEREPDDVTRNPQASPWCVSGAVLRLPVERELCPAVLTERGEEADA